MRLGWVVAVFCLYIPARGSAEEPAPEAELKKPQEPKKDEPVRVEVTAVKERESAATGSTTRLSRETVRSGFLDRTDDAAAYVPNVVQHGGPDGKSASFVVRGVGNATFFGDPTVCTYVDDIPNGDLRSLQEDLYDLSAVEAFRGPQGSAYGCNAEMGLLSYTTERPGRRWTGHAEARYGNYDTQRYSGTASGPLISDSLALKVSTSLDKRDGYLKNTFRDSRPDHRSSLAGRAQLFGKPCEGLELTATVSGQGSEDGSECQDLLSQKDPFKVSWDARGLQRTRDWLGALRLRWSAPRFELLSVSSRRHHDLDPNESDIDLTPLNLFTFLDEYKSDAWTQELRLSSREGEEEFSWRGGFYFEDHENPTKAAIRSTNTAFIQAPPPLGLGLPFTAPITNAHLSHRYERDVAFYGEAGYLAWQRLEFRFGLRGEQHEASIRRFNVIQAPSQGMTVNVVAPIVGERTDRDLLPKFSLSYRLDHPDALVYGSVARGWRPGGFSQASDDPAFGEWEPEKLWHYETGFKAAWKKPDIAFQSALFFVDVRDYLARRRTGLSFTLVNAERACSRGFETEVTARPLRGLELQFAFGYTDARFVDFDDRSTGRSFDGHIVPETPAYTFSLALNYRHRCGFFGRGELQGKGTYYFLDTGNARQHPFEVLNAKLGYEREHWSVYLYGRNLLNRDYHSLAVPDLSGAAFLAVPGAPQTYGIGATFKY